MYDPLRILMLVFTVGAFVVAFAVWLRRKTSRSGRARVRPIANADETTINRIRGKVHTASPLVSPLTQVDRGERQRSAVQHFAWPCAGP